MAPARFRLEFLDNLKRDEYAVMDTLHSIAPLNIIDVNVVPAHKCAYVHIGDHAQLEQLLTNEAKEALTEKKFKVIPPITLRSHKTVFVPRIQKFITKTPINKIKLQIEENNADCKVSEINIIEGNTNLTRNQVHLKIIFEYVEMANKVKEEGLYLTKNYVIPPGKIYPEELIQIKQCFKCFSLDHITKDCQSPDQLCSYCSDKHFYKNCPVSGDPRQYRCVLCREKHVAVSYSCPKKKELYNRIKKDQIAQRKAQPNNKLIMLIK